MKYLYTLNCLYSPVLHERRPWKSTNRQADRVESFLERAMHHGTDIEPLVCDAIGEKPGM